MQVAGVLEALHQPLQDSVGHLHRAVGPSAEERLAALEVAQLPKPTAVPGSRDDDAPGQLDHLKCKTWTFHDTCDLGNDQACRL